MIASLHIKCAHEKPGTSQVIVEKRAAMAEETSCSDQPTTSHVAAANGCDGRRSRLLSASQRPVPHGGNNVPPHSPQGGCEQGPLTRASSLLRNPPIQRLLDGCIAVPRSCRASNHLKAGVAAGVISDWRRNFAANMHHIDRLYQSLPSLNVIRTTALVGAMRQAQKQTQGGTLTPETSS